MVNGTAFVSGAFTKCTNPSFYVAPGTGTATIETPKGKVVSTFGDIQENTDAKLTNMGVNAGVGIGISGSKVGEQETQETPGDSTPDVNKDGGVHGEAVGTSSNVSGGGQIPAQPPTNTSKGEGAQ